MDLWRAWLESLEAGYELAVDSAAVVAMRSGLIASGGRTRGPEIARMVQEKIDANLGVIPILLSHSTAANAHRLPNAMIRHYHETVRANRKRLTRRN